MTGQFPQVLAGRYEIRDLIGRGGMAEVHLGYDTRLSRWVAIKLLRSDIAGDPTFQARFRREAQSAAALNHPAVVAVYDSGEEELAQPSGVTRLVPYIVMEYVEGHTVRELLSEGEAVPITEAVEIVTGVLDALEYSHRVGIVHRDIKPGNIMLTSTGAVKVMDFGIARAIEDSASTVTQTHTVVGTAQYLSPEQARGENVDARSDLYSTGCLLYELLTGQPPFQGDSAVAIAYQHVREIPKRPSALAADVPESLDRVVLKSLAKNREDRYQDASHMRTDLLAAARGLSVEAPTAESWNEPTSVIASSEGAAAFASAPVEAQEEPEEPHRTRPWLLILLFLLVIGTAALAGMWASGYLGGSSPAPKPSATAAAIAVPDVANKSEQEAKTAIEDAGLVFQRAEKDVSDDQVEAGNAVSSDPAAGTQVAKGSTVTVTFSGGSAMVSVPDVSGKSQDEARTILQSQGLSVGNATTEDHATVAKDSVIRTDPVSGTSVQRGSTVSLVLSTGQTEVPDLSGMTQEEARSALSDAGLTVGNVTQEESSTVEEGKVVSHSPNKGGQVKQGSEVNIVISSGSNKVAVPDVAGMSQEEAIKAMQDKGLQVSPEGDLVPSDSVEAGKVVSSDPAAGTEVAKGSTVRLKVSSGKGGATATPSATPQAGGGGAANGENRGGVNNGNGNNN
ncbi:Stk1 family PASTA domain-containing Ser/Thr kinase [Actinomyces bowdenii]|uniref:non-specific serine/threonine protein kinase n=1 Tax=Actinomyces bowdenii TaxID=131109 RepID=A0A853EIF5_9ACTO|nr:Stk1 family PASTA domain-containing Ser/Thr kinase [Actinomyces bowdenii]MBF0696177.1 Stk1 family PASTA domain-containing Ser/Thr kinase [Actinomyces bowdenii]NYS68350.1 Stk1 family PASTA domain-containing Ser/Thr kinase [Actinomyces bowdenii]